MVATEKTGRKRGWSRSTLGSSLSGKVGVRAGYKQILKVRRQGEAKLVILASTGRAWNRARGHAAKPGAHHRSGHMPGLCAACGASSPGTLASHDPVILMALEACPGSRWKVNHAKCFFNKTGQFYVNGLDSPVKGEDFRLGHKAKPTWAV